VSKAREEKTKLTANLLNTAAGSSFTVGVVAPMVAVYLNLGEASAKVTLRDLILNVLFWLFAATMLHLGARAILNRLDR
jgi:multisubunit Na+/H+ antiporter MnhG subunit